MMQASMSIPSFFCYNCNKHAPIHMIMIVDHGNIINYVAISQTTHSLITSFHCAPISQCEYKHRCTCNAYTQHVSVSDVAAHSATNHLPMGHVNHNYAIPAVNEVNDLLSAYLNNVWYIHSDNVNVMRNHLTTILYVVRI